MSNLNNSFNTLTYLLAQKKQELSRVKNKKEQQEKIYEIDTISCLLLSKYEDENYSLRKIMKLLNNSNDVTKTVFEALFVRRIICKDELFDCNTMEETLKKLPKDTVSFISKYAKNSTIRLFAGIIEMEHEIEELNDKEEEEHYAKHKRK